MTSALSRLAAAVTNWWRPALVLAVVLLIWWVVAARQVVPNYLVPSPEQVWQTLTGQWDFLMRNSLITL